MRKLWIVFFTMCSSLTIAQSQKSLLPNISLKSLEGKTVNTIDFENNGKPIVISFWATWCKPCAKELDAISEIYNDWQDETGVKSNCYFQLTTHVMRQK